MSLDPSIPLGARVAQIDSPLVALRQIAQLQQIRDQTEARRLAGEEARAKAQEAAAKRQRQAQIDAAIDAAYSGPPDPTTGRPTLDRSKLRAHLPGHLQYEVDQQLQEDEKTGLEFVTARLNRDTTQLQLDTLRRGFLASELRTVRSTGYDPFSWGIAVRAAQRTKAIDDETAERYVAITDPAEIKRLTDRGIEAAGGEAAKTPTVGSLEDYVTRYAASVGKAPEALTPADITTAVGQFQAANRAPAAASAPPAVGSFEDYVRRRFGATPTFEQITQARKDYQQADDRPITVNTGTGQHPITQTAEANLITRLNSQWTTATKPVRELRQQVTTMRTGLAAAERGDLAQGTEAVLQPFLKILDPNSVVREGEFWRLREGMSFLSRAQTAFQRLNQGGFVPLPELKKYAQLAEEIATRYDTYVRAERTRIGRVADRYNIPQELVFEAEAPPQNDRTTTTGPTVGERRTVNGQLAEWDGRGWRKVGR